MVAYDKITIEAEHLDSKKKLPASTLSSGNKEVEGGSGAGMTQPHKGIMIVAIAVGVFLGVFFLAPIVHVITACSNDYESPGYYLYKVGLRIFVAPVGCVQAI